MFSRFIAIGLTLALTTAQSGQYLEGWRQHAINQLSVEQQCEVAFFDGVAEFGANDLLLATGHCADGRAFVVAPNEHSIDFVLSQVANS